MQMKFLKKFSRTLMKWRGHFKRVTYYLRWAQIPPKHNVSKPTVKTIPINIPSRLDPGNILDLLTSILGLLARDGANRYGEERCPKSPVLERAAT